VPEIVEHGATGWLGTSEDELVRGVDEVRSWDRAGIRRHAVNRFAAERMIADFEELYGSVARVSKRGSTGSRAS
jgi:hypothetical protein